MGLDEVSSSGQATVRFTARGHPLISSLHATTIEITREPHISERGDCIVAVGSEYGLKDIPAVMKRTLASENGRCRLTLKVQDQVFRVQGKGSPSLTFADPSEIVVRKSGFVSERTLMVYSDMAAMDIPRRMVKLLQDPGEIITIEISATQDPPWHR